VAASCLFLLAGVRLTRERWVWSVPTLQLSLLGLLNPGVAYALGLLGLLSITASLSVLLWATDPVLIMLLGLMACGSGSGRPRRAPSGWR
jgi:drug/metabolite transporter (DMT)-like permease